MDANWYQYAIAYSNRGAARSAQGDNEGAIADYTRAIEINPQLANAYANRGVVRNALGDKAGAIVDFQRAAELYQQQGQTQQYQETLNRIQQLRQ